MCVLGPSKSPDHGDDDDDDGDDNEEGDEFFLNFLPMICLEELKSEAYERLPRRLAAQAALQPRRVLREGEQIWSFPFAAVPIPGNNGLGSPSSLVSLLLPLELLKGQADTHTTFWKSCWPCSRSHLRFDVKSTFKRTDGFVAHTSQSWVLPGAA